MQIAKALVIAFAALAVSSAVGRAEIGKWGPWPSRPDGPFTAAGFKHDDGGALVIICDKAVHIISLVLEEPRAHWRLGDPKELIVKSDVGQEIKLSGGVIGPTRAAVKNEATFGLYMMGKSHAFFAIGDGGYGRIFPMENFKSSVEVPLRACGDHW